MAALLLSRSEITALLDVPSVLGILRRGFTEATEIQPLRIRTDLPGRGTATALLPGLIPGVPAYTVKVNAKFPDASPALLGLVCLHDLADGGLLAVLDSASVTAWRTGLAAALATDVLAVADARSVSVIGAGAQAAMVLRGLAALRPLTSLTVHDIDTTRASGFAQDLGISTNTVESPQEAADRGEIVVLATWSRTPLLDVDDVRPGLHLTTLGADEPGKIELSADLLLAARTVVDDVGLAVSMGAIGNAGLGPEAVHATFSQVLSGALPGRESAEQATVYAPVGLPWQDLALAWPVYQAALASGTARTMDFLA